MKTRLLATTALMFLMTLPCLADWSQCESADFVVDTTPEPMLGVGILLLLWCAMRRRTGSLSR